jgi:hypothetical protein
MLEPDIWGHVADALDKILSESILLDEDLISQKSHKKITGFRTMAEWMAYEKGREHESNVTANWIKSWDFKTNSIMGQILHDKFEEFKNKRDD